ncbi:MAG: sensor domain-containing diguanylate cyclase [Lachnospiraceae bacterium]|nr:sensor domain-containing diguanylate cyclase [Lachnospiraceae bacterium]
MEEIKGKKCHEVISDSSNPCAACNNKRLETGCFLEEACYRPVIGKKLLLKNTVLEADGRKYRFELAVNIGEWSGLEKKYELNEGMINEGLRIALAAPTPEKSIEVLMEYIGQYFESERAYIFEELENGICRNTYEWCAGGVASQKEKLQNVPVEVVSLWYKRFLNGESVIVSNVEKIREKDPDVYEYLKPQNIKSLVVSPLISEKEIIGFYGVDNPPEKFLSHITHMLQILGYFLVSVLRRRNLVRRLEELCFQDQLTGIGNRHAMDDAASKADPEKSLGILYCDVMGLKRENDSMGHGAGDALLIRASECLQRAFGDYALFRVGGDEFLVLCEGISREELQEKVETMKADMYRSNALMALGFVWRRDGKENMDTLIAEADRQMYADKTEWYTKRSDILLGKEI